MLFPDSIDTLRVCTTCGRLFQDLPDREQPQRCECQHDSDAPSWPGYDFNERASLCRCCGREVLSSGSRWQVWFCDTCSHDVKELHNRLGGWVIPIGRHSMMHGISIKGGDVDDDKGTKEFVNASRSLFRAIDLLDEWHDRWVIELIRKSWFAKYPSVSLHTYLASARKLAAKDSRYSRDSAFVALCAAYGVPSTYRPSLRPVNTNPEGDKP